MTLYAAKCYWPGVSRSEVEQITDRAAHRAATAEPGEAFYLGSLMFAADDLVLCLFEATSRGAVKHASEQLGIPCERIMESSWLGPNLPTKEEALR